MAPTRAGRVVIAPASTRTAAVAIRNLLDTPFSPTEVVGVYRDLKKVPDEFKTVDNFRAVQGDVSDLSTLDFHGAEAVITITPPVFDGRDIATHATNVSNNVKSAIENAGSVKTLVYLSSIGAQFSKGVGEIKSNHIAEQIFSTANVPRVVMPRVAYFMENWIAFLSSGLKEDPPYIYSTITPLDYKFPMVAVKDIGRQLAAEAMSDAQPTGKPVIYDLQGPRSYTPLEVKAAFSKAVGREVAIKALEKQDLHNFYAKVFPPNIIDDWVEMATSFLPGGIAAADAADTEGKMIVRGKIELEEAIQEGLKAN